MSDARPNMFLVLLNEISEKVTVRDSNLAAARPREPVTIII